MGLGHRRAGRGVALADELSAPGSRVGAVGQRQSRARREMLALMRPVTTSAEGRCVADQVDAGGARELRDALNRCFDVARH